MNMHHSVSDLNTLLQGLQEGMIVSHGTISSTTPSTHIDTYINTANTSSLQDIITVNVKCYDILYVWISHHHDNGIKLYEIEKMFSSLTDLIKFNLTYITKLFTNGSINDLNGVISVVDLCLRFSTLLPAVFLKEMFTRHFSVVHSVALPVELLSELRSVLILMYTSSTRTTEESPFANLELKDDMLHRELKSNHECREYIEQINSIWVPPMFYDTTVNQTDGHKRDSYICDHIGKMCISLREDIIQFLTAVFIPGSDVDALVENFNEYISKNIETTQSVIKFDITTSVSVECLAIIRFFNNLNSAMGSVDICRSVLLRSLSFSLQMADERFSTFTVCDTTLVLISNICEDTCLSSLSNSEQHDALLMMLFTISKAPSSIYSAGSWIVPKSLKIMRCVTDPRSKYLAGRCAQAIVPVSSTISGVKCTHLCIDQVSSFLATHSSGAQAFALFRSLQLFISVCPVGVLKTKTQLLTDCAFSLLSHNVPVLLSFLERDAQDSSPCNEWSSSLFESFSLAIMCVRLLCIVVTRCDNDVKFGILEKLLISTAEVGCICSTFRSCCRRYRDTLNEDKASSKDVVYTATDTVFTKAVVEFYKAVEVAQYVMRMKFTEQWSCITEQVPELQPHQEAI